MSESEITELQKLLVSTHSINSGYGRWDSDAWVVNMTDPDVVLPGEIWRPHPDCADIYVSSYGRIRLGDDKIVPQVEATRSWRYGIIAALPINKGLLDRYDIGYACVCINGKWKLVYELVAQTFIGPRPAGAIIHHKSNDGWDNRPENLVYVSADAHREIHRQHGMNCPDYMPNVYMATK